MFVPLTYRARSPRYVIDVIRKHPLALLITNGQPVPYATHLPVVAREDSVENVIGATFWGHMNRANPHWPSLCDKLSAKLVFSGPGTYISPANYRNGPAAPTWDFISVHLTGLVKPISGQERTLDVVHRTARLLERAFGDGCVVSESIGYFQSIVRGVGAFEFQVTEVEAMFKLSQEKSPEIQRRLIERFSAAPPGSPRAEISALMSELGLGSG
jgi:transcriptional regulator